MRILMFGWEFPPLNSGGLGTACYGLTKALTNKDIKISFVLPRAQDKIKVDYMRLIIANNLALRENLDLKHIDSILTPYLSFESYKNKLGELKELIGTEDSNVYGSDLFREVIRYAKEAEYIANHEDFDVIHCHDWMTFGAGIKAKKISKKKGKIKPLVVHVHATEFDRTGGNPNNIIYQIERHGMENADHVITVSNYTKNIIKYYYGIEDQKISVVYNGIEKNDINVNEIFELKKHYKIVLFLGRITLQKGPDWFLKAAKEISDRNNNIRFIMAGNGDMFRNIVEESVNLGIADKIFFTDFLRGIDVDRAYELADVYVMPSVSEPFGITALEALNRKKPIVISKQSGVAEIINNCYKVDFWDSWKIADSIIEILNNEHIKQNFGTDGYEELKNITWDNSASSCISIYNKLVGDYKW